MAKMAIMAIDRNIRWSDPVTIALLATASFLVVNVVFTLFQLFNKPINPDELQHLHIAWLVAQGEIVYRDFWDHHGPLYSLLNGALLYLLNPEPSLEILFWLRALSLATTFGVMVLIWQIARRLNLSNIGALLAVAAYASLYIVQAKGVEMRGDPMQSMLWVAGVYLLVRNQSDANIRNAILAGALFTLSVLTNTKAGIGPFFVFIFYLAGRWICGCSWEDAWRDMRGIMTGAAITATPFIVYFWLNGALYQLFYYSFLWNIEVILYWSNGYQFEAAPSRELTIGAQNLQYFVTNQLPFFALSVVGALFWLGRLKHQSDQAARQRNWIFLVVALGTALGWRLDLYQQFFLMFLPFWAIFVSHALTTIGALIARRNAIAGPALGTLIAVVAAGGMLWNSISTTNFTEHPKLTRQVEFTDRFVAMTPREEPVGVIWSQCGGYMFNRNVGYYWAALSDVSEIIEVLTGEHPHGQGFIEEMEAQQVRYVVGMSDWLTEGLTDEAMEYLRANFDYTDCLWTRKSN
jgi:hypothetical protein